MGYVKEAYEQSLEVHDAAAHNTLKVGTGTLVAVVINDPGTTWVIPVYDDGAAGTTKLIATIKAVAGQTLIYKLRFGNGLRIGAGSGTPGSLTIIWE